jgi:hypothetical protein
VRATARRVDDDLLDLRLLEGLDRAPGERERGGVLPRVRVQGPAAGLRARGHDLEAVMRQDARGRAVVRAEDGLLDAAGEEAHAPSPDALGRGHLGQRRPVRRGRQLGQQRLPVPERRGQEREQARSTQHAAQAARLIEPQARRGQPQEARARQQQREVHPAEEPPQRAARPLALDLRARRLDELAVGHARGTHGLAGAAAETEIQMGGGGVGQGDASLGQRLDQ